MEMIKMLRIEQNPYNKNEYSVIETNEDYHEAYLEDLTNYNNGDEVGLVNFCESLGIKVEYYCFRRDKICTKEEYLKHFENYDSDKEYIFPTATFTQEQALQVFNKLQPISK